MIIKSTYDPHTLAMKRLRGKIMYKYYTVESQVQAMRAYTTSFQKMPQTDAKVKAVKALQSSKVLDQSGNLNNDIFFRKSQFVKE